MRPVQATRLSAVQQRPHMRAIGAGAGSGQDLAGDSRAPDSRPSDVDAAHDRDSEWGAALRTGQALALGLAVAARAMVVALPAVLVLVFEVVDDALGAGT